MNKLYVLAFCVAFCVPVQAQGCTIPVFRYALEKWDLTSYEILVVHRGPLSVDLQKTLDKWNATPSKANVDITFLDPDAKSSTKLRKSQIELAQSEGYKDEAPWMLVRYQAPRQKAFTAWSGPCTLANLHSLLDSPMRQTILAHLTRGASGVFVLLTSGDEQKDKAAYNLAVKTLQSLEKKIKLPEQDADGPQLTWRLPLKVWLPVVTLDRSKPEEAVLVRLLLNTGEELAEAKGPILFPIYGRGRALPGLTGEDLSEKYLLTVTSFLCGPCSCTIKAFNPGLDLLLVADWKEIPDKLFAGKEGLPVPEVSLTIAPSPSTGAKVLAVRVPTVETASSLVMTEAIEATQSQCVICRNWLWIATALAGGLVLVTGAWACWSWRK
jgi:hypothetical protein